MAKTLTLRSIPPDVYKFLLDEQWKEKKEKGRGMFSLESTVYKLIKESPRYPGKEERK